MPPKPVPAVWLVLLVAKSGVGTAAVDKFVNTLLVQIKFGENRKSCTAN